MAKAQQKGEKYIGRFSLLIILFTGRGQGLLERYIPYHNTSEGDWFAKICKFL